MERSAGKKYEVLRLVKHGNKCYVSSDYIAGQPLAQWLKYHPIVEKRRLLGWMQEILRQLELFHQCGGKPCYQYVNPYSFIVTPEQELYLLDLGSSSQEALLRQMQRRAVRENFLSVQNQYYQKADLAEDIYGLGKTMQYLLSAAEPDPPWKRQEERRFQKIISRCLTDNSKKKYQTIQEISEHFPKIQKSKKESKKGSHSKRKSGKTLRRILLVALLLTGIAGGAQVYFRGNQAHQNKPKDQNKPEDQNRPEDQQQLAGDKGSKEGAEKKLQLDMGMLYFLELMDYKKSQEQFENIAEESELAEHCGQLSGYLLRGTEGMIGRNLEQLLEEIEQEIPNKEDARYYRMLLRGYALLDTKEAAEEKIRIAEYCMNLEEWKKEDGEHEKEKEIKSSLAVGYEQTEQNEKAVLQYQELLEMESDHKKQEQLYVRLAVLYEQTDQVDQAWETCKKGIESISDSKELRLLLIRLQCREPSVDRQICADTVKQYIKEMPELADTEEFKKLQQEYEIKIEGEQVWVGK